MTVKISTLGKIFLYIAVAIALIMPIAALAGVDDDINEFVGRQNKHYWETQPVHFYDYSAPRDLLIQYQDATIPVMRDTWTVFYDAGIERPIDWCFSKGVPLPGSVQLTNPQYMKTDGNGGDSATSVTLEQPEPSGLYTSGDNWQTIVSCVLPNGQVSPVIWEGETIVYFSPIHVDEETGRIIHDDGGSSAPLTIRGQ